MRRILFLIICVALLLPAPMAVPDTVLTVDEDFYDGVVLKETSADVTIQTSETTKIIPREDIKKITYDKKKNNLLKLAGFAQARGDKTGAYYYYQKAFLLDPESEQTISGLTSVDDAVIKNADKATGVQFVYDDERLQSGGNPKKESDTEILNNNVELIDELLKKFGLILKADDDRVTVEEVLAGSAAEAAGLQNSDVVVSLNEKNVMYMGRYDVVQLLLRSYPAPSDISILRDVNVWIASNERINEDPSLSSNAGFELTQSSGRIEISSLSKSSPIYKYGIRDGDTLISINDISAKNMNADEAARTILSGGPSNVKLVVQKKLRISPSK